MRRLFSISVVLFGACAALLLPSAVATADTKGDVSHIYPDTGSLKMVGCDGRDSLLQFSFTSTGTGTVTATATAVDSDTIVGESKEPVVVDSERTDVTLSIHDGYVGEARIVIEAANYAVPIGQKGDQTASNEFTTTVGIVNCEIGAPEPAALADDNPAQSTEKNEFDQYKPIIIWTLGAASLAAALIGLALLIFRKK